MTENEISYKVRGILFNIYNKLGPGLYESVYEEILAYELKKTNLQFSRQQALPVIWEDLKMDQGFRADIIVENKVIIEIKSVERIINIHYKQLLTYLKVSKLKLGLLVNFNDEPLFIKRIVNNL
jgi:GxxExxY protein